MVKICHMLDNLNVGGLEKIAIDIVLNLKGYEHQMWCLKEKGMMAAELEAKGIRVRAFNFEGRLSIPALSRLIRELKKERFSAIHCHGLFPSVWARIAAIFAHIPVRIVHCHSTYYGLFLKDRIRLWLLSFYTTNIIAVSHAVKKSLVDYVCIPAGKVSVIYNGIDDIGRDRDSKRGTARAQLGLASDDFVIGCLGRLVDMKGQRYLIDAMSLILKSHGSCKCLIIGEGPQKQELLEHIQKSGLGKSVLLLGMRRDVPDLLSAMDIVASPSVLKEGLPLALAEGAAMALPLVATGIGGSPEVVHDRVNGFIVHPRDPAALADKICFLIEHPDVRQAMGERSRKIWETDFRKDDMLKNIDRIYCVALKRIGRLP